MLAGRLTPADYFESDAMMAAEVSRAFEFMCSDPKWGPLVTAEQRKSSLESQFALVRLYEAATKKTLMTEAVNETNLAEAVANLHEVQATRKTAVTASSAARKRGPRAVVAS